MSEVTTYPSKINLSWRAQTDGLVECNVSGRTILLVRARRPIQINTLRVDFADPPPDDLDAAVFISFPETPYGVRKLSVEQIEGCKSKVHAWQDLPCSPGEVFMMVPIKRGNSWWLWAGQDRLLNLHVGRCVSIVVESRVPWRCKAAIGGR